MLDELRQRRLPECGTDPGVNKQDFSGQESFGHDWQRTIGLVTHDYVPEPGALQAAIDFNTLHPKKTWRSTTAFRNPQYSKGSSSATSRSCGAFASRSETISSNPRGHSMPTFGSS